MNIPDLDVRPTAPERSGTPGPRVSAAPADALARSSGRPGAAPGPVRVSANPSPRVSAAPASASLSGRAPPGPAPSQSPQDYFGSGTFDADHFGDADVSIALDTGDAPPRFSSLAAPLGGRGSLAPADDGDLDLFEGNAASGPPPQVSQPPASLSDPRKWPTGVSPESASLRIDAVDVALVADYGDSPPSFLLAPLYAMRVIQRRTELKRRVQDLSTGFTAAEASRDGLLVTLVQELRGKILMTEEGERAFEKVVELEKIALERRETLAGTNAEYDRLVGEIDDENRAADVEATEKRARTEAAAGAEEQAKRVFDRAEAKRKRLYIELRGIVEASEKAGGAMSSAQSARVAELEGQIAAQKPEHDAAARGAEAARASTAAAENDERLVAKKKRDLEAQRRDLDQQFKKQVGARSAGVSTAEQERHRALADVGRQLLKSRGRLADVPTDRLDALRRADRTVVERATELEKHVRALDSYDRSGMKNGLVVAAVALLVLVLGLVALVNA